MNKLLKKILIIIPFFIIMTIFFISFKESYLEQKTNPSKKIILDLENPGNCISAKSSCNVCSRKNKEGIFICTDTVCENESFYCTKHEKNNQNKNSTDKAGDEGKIIAGSLEKTMKEISLKIDYPLPQIPSVELDSKTVLGVDSNNNGVRDITEIIIYQGLNLVVDDKKIYYKMLQFIDMIEPSSEEVIPNSKNKHKIYCSYKKLPLIVKKEFPLSLIYSFVLDTQKRKTIFYNSIKDKDYPRGEEKCE
jgi:hypothetical protein